jgi:pyruvate kinase
VIPFPEIVCTLGTTTDDPVVLRGMAAAGMGMARVNTAHGGLEEIERRIRLVREAAGVPVLLDLKGPQLRLECVTERSDPATGATVEAPCRYPVALGDLIWVGFGAGPVRFPCNFAEDLRLGDLITFENGTIRTRVVDPGAQGVEPTPNAVLLEVVDAGAGKLEPGMGAAVPGRYLHVPRHSPRDLEAVELGIRLGVEGYALSYVRDAADMVTLHRVLAGRDEPRAMLVAKIEERWGVDNLEEIVAAGRECGREVAVMVARGDLVVELPWEELPAVQTDLVRRCRALGVPSIVATGLLLSMQHAPVPARSEVCDVAAAVREGADALMLSDETSNGVDPVRAVRALAVIARRYRPAAAGA